jgi:hypothetical protein
MSHWSLDKPGSTEDPARSVVVDPAGPPSGRSAEIIPFPVRLSAAAFEPVWDSEDADCFEPIGVLACRLVGQWSLPRILVWGAPED